MQSFSKWVAGFVTALTTGCASEASDDVRKSEIELRSTTAHKLVAQNAAAVDRLGNSVAMSADAVLLGSSLDDESFRDQGTVLAYERAGLGWIEAQLLVAPDAASGAEFGRSVALGGDTAIVGADGAVAPGLSYEGSVYLFRRMAGEWIFSQQLTADDEPSSTGFGVATAITGDTLVVGGYSSAFVFTHRNGEWASTQRLTPPPEATAFGRAVAISGDLILVGSPELDGESGSGARAGAAYVFERFDESFELVATLTPADTSGNSRFGEAVAISGNTALVGAHRADDDRGIAHVYVREGSTFREQATLHASDGVDGDHFGASLALLGDMALVGAPFHEHEGRNENHGSAYLFMRTGASWTEKEELRAADGQNNDFFGSALTLSGANALVGSPNDDFPLRAQGSAYVFGLRSEMGEACGAGAQCPSGFCSDGRCCDKACTGACDACSIAAGAAVDGECSLLPEGSPGSPACASGACTGASDVCPGGSACSTCVTDSDCAGSEYCSGALVCLPRKEQGRACESAAGLDCHVEGCRVCASGACVDGFCCDSSCEGECLACSGAVTGEPDGTCAAVIASADPEHRCEPHSGSGFSQISAGNGFTCGLGTDSRISCWGRNEFGQTDPPAGTFNLIATGAQSGCAVRTGGGIICWGDDRFGLATPPAGPVAALSLNFHHACASRSNGPATCWGSDSEGRASPPPEAFIRVSAGLVHGCGLRADATVACWGALNDFGQTNPPPGQYHSLSAGGSTTCALRSDNTVACWGGEVYPDQPPPPGTFRMIDIDNVYGCGVRTDDTIACWGAHPAHLAPTGTFKSLSTGALHACAIRMDDEVVCWGSNTYGELDPPR